MAAAEKAADRVKPSKEPKPQSDSSTDELAEKSSSDDETPLIVPKTSEKKTAAPEERRAQVINQFTFSIYINMI